MPTSVMPSAPKLDRYAKGLRTANMDDPPIRHIQWADDDNGDEPMSPAPTPRDLNNPPNAPKGSRQRLPIPFVGRVLVWD